jgi:hypothetical protein
MFCPQCGSTHSDELKFCKSCGANLGIVREALISGEAPPKFDWSKTWVAEMLQSSEQAVRKEKELERLKGITPEVKRRNEVKAGVITASVGLGVMILVYILMQGIILSGSHGPGDEEVLSRVWIAGIIPFLVGIALIINGTIVSKMFASNEGNISERANDQIADMRPGEYLPPADTSRFPDGFSVTDQTTQHLKEPISRQRSNRG